MTDRLSRALVGALTVLALAALPVRAQAQSCGNGVLNLGEECDDGNTVPGDCCAADCRLEPAFTVCRPSIAPCDLAEVCTGDTDACPADTGILGDGDADGLCDPLDDCPAAFDPLQADTDDDGIGNACDPCTNIYPGTIAQPRLRLRKLDHPIGNQRIKFRGILTVPDEPAIDPPTNGLRLVVTDATGATINDITVPPGARDDVMRHGWVQVGVDGTRWVFTDGEDLVFGVDKVTIHVAPSRSPRAKDVRLMLQSRGDGFGVPAALPVTVTVVVDTPLATTGQCAEVVMDEESCRFKNQAGKLVCNHL